jgi:glycogen operon protein
LADEPRFYTDFTGCGNTLNVRHPQVVKLICDSLRYWVTSMHVDGFRFDLAAALGRNGEGDFSPNAPLFQAIHQDPVLSRVKLIAEPWDVGMNGYRLGQFPIAWAEWNGRYRETLRRFWKGEEKGLSEIGYRLSGSSDLFKASGRRATASINYVTSHDGFTLNDLVSYELKHNEANQEGNRDGGNDNDSWNCGVEGDSTEPAILDLRERQKRNLLTTLFLSIGTPMLCAGDEMGRTQMGNNNAYCQDNAISWLNWDLTETQRAHLAFTQRLLSLRKEEPVLQRRNFFRGQTIADSRFKDLVWFRPDGGEMSPEDWAAPSIRSLAYLLGGDAITARDPNGQRIIGDTLLVLLNGQATQTPFTVPAVEWGRHWQVVVDTRTAAKPEGAVEAGGTLTLWPFSVVVLKHPVGG